MTCATTNGVLYFDIGDPVKIEGAFQLESSSEGYDPSVVRLKVLDPLGAITSFLYGTDAELERTAEGGYLLIWPAGIPGLHEGQWEAEDTGSEARYGVDPWQFIVNRSPFYTATGSPAVGSGGSGGIHGGSP